MMGLLDVEPVLCNLLCPAVKPSISGAISLLDLASASCLLRIVLSCFFVSFCVCGGC